MITQRYREINLHIFGNRAEFVILERHLSGQPQRDALVLRELQIRGGLAHLFDRVGSRLQRRIVDDRLDQDDAPRIGRRRRGLHWLRRAGGEQFLPGDAGWFSRQHQFEGVRHFVESGGEHREAAWAAADLPLIVQDNAGEAAQAGILRDRLQNVALGDQRSHDAPDLRRGQKQQAVGAKEFIVVGAPGARDHRRALQRRVEPFGGVFGFFRGRAVDHRDNEGAELRKGLVKRGFILAPGNVGRKQMGCVGVDRKSRRGEICSAASQRQGRQHDQPRPTQTKPHQFFKHQAFPQTRRHSFGGLISPVTAAA